MTSRDVQPQELVIVCDFPSIESLTPADLYGITAKLTPVYCVGNDRPILTVCREPENLAVYDHYAVAMCLHGELDLDAPHGSQDERKSHLLQADKLAAIARSTAMVMDAIVGKRGIYSNGEFDEAAAHKMLLELHSPGVAKRQFNRDSNHKWVSQNAVATILKHVAHFLDQKNEARLREKMYASLFGKRYKPSRNSLSNHRRNAEKWVDGLTVAGQQSVRAIVEKVVHQVIGEAPRLDVSGNSFQQRLIPKSWQIASQNNEQSRPLKAVPTPARVA